MNLRTLLSLFLLFLYGCGYKVVDQNYFKDYKIIETSITGDKRVVYLLRNKLNSGGNTGAKAIKLNLKTEKKKQIKEKNIQNEITKYEISITAEISFYSIEENVSGKFFVSKNGDYNIEDRYSDTLNNEKKLVKNLVNDISEQIMKNLQIKLDEL